VRHLVLIEKLTNDGRIRITKVPEDAHAGETGGLEHDPASLERFEQLVTEVGSLLDDAGELARADAIGPNSPLAKAEMMAGRSMRSERQFRVRK
jgi:hypothetical protein